MKSQKLIKNILENKDLFVISAEDVQLIAQDQLNRKLTTEELKVVRNALDHGLDSWADIAIETIDEITNK